MSNVMQELCDPIPEAEWQVWYQDTFDRECPLSVDVRGQGLAIGLIELWARYLFEAVRPGGVRGFSRFHLRWGQDNFVDIKGSWAGATRLREWVFGTKKHSRRGYVAAGDVHLLKRIAVTHAWLIVRDQPADQILEAAADAQDRPDFEGQLAALAANYSQSESGMVDDALEG
jgi:hypothetical protein